MKYGMIIGLFALVLLSMTVFAAAPTMGPITAYPFASTDRNYSNWTNSPAIPGYISLSSLVTGADLNDKNCYYSLSGGVSWDLSIVDMNNDTNIIEVGLVTSGENINTFGLKCTNNAGEESTPAYIELWLDANAPTVSSLVTEFDSRTNINMTATDHATQTGDGVGVDGFYYKIDNGAMYFSAGASNNLQYDSPVQAVGAHTLKYYVLDNFDNNTGWLTLDFNIRGTAPVITGNTRVDHNTPVRSWNGSDYVYYDYPFRFQSGVITDVDEDLNELSCKYTLSAPTGAWVNADFNADVNRCQLTVLTWGNTDGINLNFKVSDDTNLWGTGDANYLTLDATAPVTVGTFDNFNTITLTSTDDATTQGVGSGVRNIYYSVDGAAWVTSSSNPINIVVTGVGHHHIFFYAVDNLDNNEGAGMPTGYWDKPFDVPAISQGSTVCNLTMLMMLVLVAAAIVSVLGLAYTGNLNIETATAATIALITFLVILIITGQVNAVMCS
jgi:hypothetical protein